VHTVINKGEVEEGGYNEGEATRRVVDLLALSAEPAVFCLKQHRNSYRHKVPGHT